MRCLGLIFFDSTNGTKTLVQSQIQKTKSADIGTSAAGLGPFFEIERSVSNEILYVLFVPHFQRDRDQVLLSVEQDLSCRGMLLPTKAVRSHIDLFERKPLACA